LCACMGSYSVPRIDILTILVMLSHDLHETTPRNDYCNFGLERKD
jgi:hypothetical protein